MMGVAHMNVDTWVQWLLLQFIVLLMMDAKGIRNM